MTFSYSDRKKGGRGHAKCIYPLLQNMQIIDPYNNNSWQGVTGMARVGGLTGSYFLNVDLTGGLLVGYLTSFWKASSWQMSDVRYWSASEQVVALEKKVRRLTQREGCQRQTARITNWVARVWLCLRGMTHRCTHQRGGREARQIDITTGINYTAFILSFPLKDSSLLTRGGLVFKSKNVQLYILLNDRQ